MSKYENRQEIANKLDYEGGIYEFVFGYGLDVYDLPQDDTELIRALQAVLDTKHLWAHLESLLPEPRDEDWDD